MLFKKKKEVPANPYYEEKAEEKAGPAPQSNQQPQQVVHQNPQPAPSTIPLVPIPPPIQDVSGDLQPIKLGGINTIDALRLEAGSKSFAFVKLSDFKDILDDIKALEKRIAQSREDLEAFSATLKKQEDYIRRYNEMNSDLKKMIDRISSSLSDIQE